MNGYAEACRIGCINLPGAVDTPLNRASRPPYLTQRGVEVDQGREEDGQETGERPAAGVATEAESEGGGGSQCDLVIDDLGAVSDVQPVVHRPHALVHFLGHDAPGDGDCLGEGVHHVRHVGLGQLDHRRRQYLACRGEKEGSYGWVNT